MIACFLRSSSLNDLELCQGRYWITYNIGRRGMHSRATIVGSIVHAVMEACALIKLAEQKNSNSFIHAEFGEWDVGNFYIPEFLEFIYYKYQKENPTLIDPQGGKDLSECKKLVNQALSYSNNTFNPRNNEVFAVEHQFDLTIDRPWAHYSYETPNGVLEGQLCLKGTVDIIYKEDKDTLHVVDYKTSKGIDNWATGEEKTPENLKHDNQLLLYYYALAKSFPQYKTILITLYFIRLNKPFTVIFERSELSAIEEEIKKKYLEIISTEKPTWLKSTPNKWKCKWCPHSQTKEPNGRTTCDFFSREATVKGLNAATLEHADFSQIDSYGQGASHKERK